MLELRTSGPWRVAYWVIALLQALFLSLAIAGGDTARILVSLLFAVVFFVLALQSRHPVRISEDGVADERVLVRRAWRWDEVDLVTVRAPSWFRPDVQLRHGRGRNLPLNLGTLVVTLDGEPVDRITAAAQVAALARRYGVTVRDERREGGNGAR